MILPYVEDTILNLFNYTVVLVIETLTIPLKFELSIKIIESVNCKLLDYIINESIVKTVYCKLKIAYVVPVRIEVDIKFFIYVFCKNFTLRLVQLTNDVVFNVPVIVLFFCYLKKLYLKYIINFIIKIILLF